MDRSKDSPMKKSKGSLWELLPGAIFVLPYKEHPTPLYLSEDFKELFSLESKEEEDKFFQGGYLRKISPEDIFLFASHFEAPHLEDKGEITFDCRFLSGEGNYHTLRFQYHAIEEEGEKLLLGIVNDVSADQSTEDKSVSEGEDTISRIEFLSLLPQIVEENDPENPPVILYYDIANFRYINFYYGMQAGDDFLREVTKILRETYPGSLFSRIEGDHFALLTNSQNLKEKVDTTRSRIKALNPSLPLDIRVGACLYAKGREEKALSSAKLASDLCRNNGNYFSFYNKKIGEALELSDYVVSHLEKAIQNGWIQVYYQPIVRAISKQLCSMEALARWIDPNLGMLLPSVFIEALEEAQCIHKLDLYVIEEVCKQLKKNQEQGIPEIPCSINLSRIDFLTCDIFAEVENLVRKYSLSRRMFHIEVTETVLISHSQAVLNVLSRFRNAGYEIWMDDFGSGYSTLKLLKDYSFDVLKIDMAFLKKETPRGRDIIASIIAMDKKIGNRTLAEGVETEEQFDFLRRAGCDKVQGYLFGKPLPFSESLKGCLANGIGIEPTKWKNYYDSLETVDFQTDRPMLLLEFENDKFHTLFVNALFESAPFPNKISTTLSEVDAFLNDPELQTNLDLLKTAQHANYAGAEGDLFYSHFGDQLKCHYRRVSRIDKRILYEVEVTNIDPERKRLTEEDRVARALRNYYDDLLLINLTTHTIRPFMVALSNASQGYSFGDSIEKMMEHLPEIFLADKERYLAFLDPKTLEERVHKAPGGNLQGVFRTKDEFGRYSWKFHHVISVPDRNEKVFLYATRSFDIPSFCEEAALIDSDSFAPLVTGEKENKDKSSEKEALFDDFMLHSPFPFFWKDRQRRFLGASQSFLEYYGFSSLDEILGKTDEDLHWHPENFTYRKDEEEVLSTGKVHIAIPGRCIARGVTRNILATKWPLLRDGKICGLMGYFIDENTVSSLLERERPSSKSNDPLLPIENFSNFLDDMARYRGEYQINHLLYGVILLKITSLRRIAKTYGESFSRLVLKEAALRILKRVQNEGIVSRFDSDGFAVLFRYQNPSEINDLAGKLKQDIEEIKEIEHSSVTLYTDSVILYAEVACHFSEALEKTLFELSKKPETDGEKEEIAISLLDTLPCGSYLLRSDNTLRYLNHKGEELLGYSKDEMIGKKVTGDHLGSAPMSLSETSGNSSLPLSEDSHILLATEKDGNKVLLRHFQVPFPEGEGKIGYFYPITSDKDEAERIEEVYHEATKDALTGLPGRKYLDACLADAFGTYHKSGKTFALLFADIDDFHNYNNLYGHEVGDQILIGLAESLKSTTRKMDRLCRYGGDEFVALFPLEKPEDTLKISARCLSLPEKSFETNNGKVFVPHFSFGITCVRKEDDALSLINRADRYMFLAKKVEGVALVNDFNVDEILSHIHEE